MTSIPDMRVSPSDSRVGLKSRVLSALLRLSTERVGRTLCWGCVQPLLSNLGFSLSSEIMLNIWYQELIYHVGHASRPRGRIPESFLGLFLHPLRAEVGAFTLMGIFLDCLLTSESAFLWVRQY